MKKYIIFMILMVILGGCASYQSPKEYKFDKTRTYNQKFDDIWDKLIHWFAINNNKITTIDKNSGLIVGLKHISTEEGVCDCGWSSLDYSYIYIDTDINIVIRTNNIGKVIVEINTSSKWHKLNGLYSIRNNCNSTGKIEKEIFDYLEQGDKLPRN